ncbi:uncharacterized protein LOC106051329 isoform X1 [Biomphalaria glabrata]|uniref:Uncharacterized protein LOC106051329 isoform X1 n=2 Tax=Biomphalaria glabrata TaxID=6526 RepID=A0A9W2YXG9_BIOGL|nr:uncharacterized protein LOC106051329 isoform X1 [Biomphalaria glabrata]XP_055867411.1 uncharacterized protein LOC106051329 isoform X1 [Biomphalaria glabrata]XP_055867412.1 uncharacterized protein LOC106051329 isoform X1 [Biomphalaria glabrata]KAI8779883.1 hypothetical protein BgiBS90_019077 [Biomphalaria glabrata]
MLGSSKSLQSLSLYNAQLNRLERENKVLKYITLFLLFLMLTLLAVSSFSASWTITSAGGTVYKTEGMYWSCTLKSCAYQSRPSGWHETVRYLVYLMWMLLLGTLTLSICSLFIIIFRVTTIFAFLYMITAFFGFLVLIIYPVGVSPIGKDNLNETWFGYGYYTFLASIVVMIILSLMCFEMIPDTYPGL